MREYLEPTEFVDSDHPTVRGFVDRATDGATDERERIARVFTAVRDGIRYDPYGMSLDRADYRASAVVGRDGAFCVPKAVLLVAAARAMGIPARLAFADVRNHLSSPRMLDLLGTDLFVYHGYGELHVDGAWRKASPAFNATLCERFGVEALDFDGTEDALLHPFSGDGSRYMEYVNDRGSHADLPFDAMMDELRRTYPRLHEVAGTTSRRADPAFAPTTD
ncbi:MAG: transglutaminase family protein [Solirubrobacteraceae bacterium]|nr:transglutaminase family protein [Solirubrobacteraceae bacterium]